MGLKRGGSRSFPVPERKEVRSGKWGFQDRTDPKLIKEEKG